MKTSSGPEGSPVSCTAIRTPSGVVKSMCLITARISDLVPPVAVAMLPLNIQCSASTIHSGREFQLSLINSERYAQSLSIRAFIGRRSESSRKHGKAQHSGSGQIIRSRDMDEAKRRKMIYW